MVPSPLCGEMEGFLFSSIWAFFCCPSACCLAPPGPSRDPFRRQKSPPGVTRDPKAAQRKPKSAQRRPEGSQRRSKGSSRRPKRRQREPKDSPRHLPRGPRQPKVVPKASKIEPFFARQQAGSPSSAPRGARYTPGWVVPNLPHVNSHAQPLRPQRTGKGGSRPTPEP